MRYTRNQFTSEYYRLWESGLHLPVPKNGSIYRVKLRLNQADDMRISLAASSVSDALERACYAVTMARVLRPEDVDLHAVYDSDDNVLWLDEPFLELVQKKHAFRGMERREFLARFGLTAAAVLFGLRPSRGLAASTTVSLSGTASGFTLSDSFVSSQSWIAPATGLYEAIIIGGGGPGYNSDGSGCGGGGGGGFLKVQFNLTAAESVSMTVGAAGTKPASYGAGTSGGASSLNVRGVVASAGGGSASTGATGASGGTNSANATVFTTVTNKSGGNGGSSPSGWGSGGGGGAGGGNGGTTVSGSGGSGGSAGASYNSRSGGARANSTTRTDWPGSSGGGAGGHEYCGGGGGANGLVGDSNGAYGGSGGASSASWASSAGSTGGNGVNNGSGTGGAGGAYGGGSGGGRGGGMGQTGNPGAGLIAIRRVS